VKPKPISKEIKIKIKIMSKSKIKKQAAGHSGHSALGTRHSTLGTDAP